MCRLLALVAMLLFPCLAATQAADPSPPKGFRAIFNGRDLTGWYGLNPHPVAKLEGERREAALAKQREEFAQHWRIEGGELVNDGTGPYATTEEDFGDIEHRDGVSPAWPITYDDLAPWYDEAERLYHVHGEGSADPTEPERGPYPHPPVPHADAMLPVIAGLERQGLHPSPLPLGLIDPGQPGGCQLCNTCNSFPCRIHRKSDADVARPFRTPGVPVVPLLGVAFCLLLMSGLPLDTWLRLIGWLVIGLAIYFLYGRHHSALRARTARA